MGFWGEGSRQMVPLMWKEFQAEGRRKQRRMECCAHVCGSAEEPDGLEGRVAGDGCAGGLRLGKGLGLQFCEQWQLPRSGKQRWPGVCWPSPTAWPCSPQATCSISVSSQPRERPRGAHFTGVGSLKGEVGLPEPHLG